MLLFSTVLKLHPAATRQDLIQSVLDWNQAIPHEGNRIEQLGENTGLHGRFGSDRLWLEILDYAPKNITSIRFEKQDDQGCIWDSDYTANFERMEICIRLERSWSEDALCFDPAFSTPYYIKFLIEKGLLAMDGLLEVGMAPVYITKDNSFLLSSLVLGISQYALPVVYVSKTRDNQDPIDVSRLAWRLKGIAHVLVQADVQTNALFQTVCCQKNEYNGTIGIYFPNPAYAHHGHRRLFVREKTQQEQDHLFERCVKSVLRYVNSQQADTLSTWPGVVSAILLEKLNAQKADMQALQAARNAAENKAAQLALHLNGQDQEMYARMAMEARKESEELLESFDAEQKAMRQQLRMQSRQLESLRFENEKLRQLQEKTGSQVPLLEFNGEMELYPGEIKDLVLNVLQSAGKSLPPDSRRMDVIRDIVQGNNYTGLCEQRARSLKEIFQGYRTMTGSMKKKLEDLGFEITRTGKHYHLVYYNDSRYTFTLARSASDQRAGKNNAAIIAGKVF